MNPEQRRTFALFPRSGKTGGRARAAARHLGAEPQRFVERLIRPFFRDI